MYCDGCGAVVQPGQSFCSKCGKQIVGTIAYMPARASRVQRHVRFVALFWMALSAFNVLGGVALYFVANLLFPQLRAKAFGGGPPEFLTPLLTTVAILLLAKAACGFFAGWGLLHHDHWGRTVALVMAFISLFTNIPFGTALGIYTMWVLLPAESEQEYEALSAVR
jgi:phage shock protein PspC (stress-responsive transcriptional regulator)